MSKESSTKLPPDFSNSVSPAPVPGVLTVWNSN